MTRHVVQFSGGIGSFAAALRVAATHGTDDLVLLIANTQVEDPDLWRFAAQAAEHIGVPLTVVADGRTPFQVFADQRFLGNSRLAPCSVHLKQRPCRAWLREHTDPADTILYVGIDWSEQHRTHAIEAGWPPWPVVFPMCQPPLLSKEDMLAECRAVGIEPPRLYELGFSHNNFFWTTVGVAAPCWSYSAHERRLPQVIVDDGSLFATPGAHVAAVHVDMWRLTYSVEGPGGHRPKLGPAEPAATEPFRATASAPSANAETPC